MDLCSTEIRESNNKRLIELLEYVENIDEKNKDGNGLYFVAAWNNNIEALDILKERNAIFEKDINIAGSRYLSVLKYLKKNEMLDVMFKDKNGFNPLQQICVLNNYTYILLGKNEEEKKELEKTTQERIKCIDFLVNEGVDINIITVERL